MLDSKVDSKVDPANKRPISVLSVIAKLFEKAIFNQVYSYINDNKLLSKYQSGFIPMHSTVTALIDNWYLNIDDGLTNAILFIDLKKVFDTIETLLSKLELYGFKGVSSTFSETTSAKFPHSPILHYACGSMCVVLCFATKKQQKQRKVPQRVVLFLPLFSVNNNLNA